MKKWMLPTLAGLMIIWEGTVSSQPVIRIWGTKDSIIVRNQVAQYLDYLEVQEDIHLQIIFLHQLPNALAGITYELSTIKPWDYRVFRVYVDNNLTKYEQKLVLAHEMIHVKQYVKGELKVADKEYVNWQRQEYHYDFNHNTRMPWENEAAQEDKTLAKVYKAPLMAMVKKR